MPDLDCQSHQDISAGLLNSTQTVEWEGRPLPARLHATLAARMDEEHVAAVGSSVARLIRCRVEGDEVICTGMGLLPLLTFGRPVTETDGQSVRRTWAVTGGWLARRGDLYGSIRFEWRQQESGGGRWRHRLCATVDGYPSRFLRKAGPARAAWRIGDWYAGYHRRVTCGFLRRLAAWIRASSEGN